MIARNYEPAKIGRNQTMVSGGNLSSLGTGVARGFRTVEQAALPALRGAGLFAARQVGRAGVAAIKPVIQGAGMAAGGGLALATGQPELTPYLVGAGGLVGNEAAKYLQSKADKAIDRWR